MKAERYAEIYDIVSLALNLESAKRETFLNEKCKGDLALRGEVEEALAYIPRAETEGYLECSPVSIQVDEPADAFIGTIISGYKVVEYIGGGGQGDVYRAISTGELKNQVAIKILRAGLNADQILRRYKLEIRIYETLGEHPNITHVHSAGKTEDNRLFFVMEYIDGQPISDYCDNNNLSLRDRAKLLLVVFEALKHAHGSLVIHRDIKPHNILVTRDGIPKLLDFGIAKLLERDAEGVRKEQSWTEHPPLTPEYASPEQVMGGQMLGIATDVYSIGVVLYELLTGHRPYEINKLTYQEIQRVVCEEKPISPETVVAIPARGKSTGADKAILTPQIVAECRGTSPAPLRRELATDIKTILLYALRKLPDKRYRSIGEFSVDLKNWVDRRPIKYARKPATSERIGYWIRRNPTATLATVMAGVLVVLGTVLWTEKEVRQREILSSTDFSAELVAWTLEIELKRLKQAVDRAATTQNLRDYLNENDAPGLQKYIEDVATDSQMTADEPLPIESWAIFDNDPKATMLVHSLSTEESVGENFDFRDYMIGALREAQESGEATGYISRVYRSQAQPHLFKFAIAQAVRDEGTNGKILGVIIATLKTSRAMGLEAILDPRFEVILVGPWDPNPNPRFDEPTPSSDFLIFLHPSYPAVQENQSGQRPVRPIPFPDELDHVLHGGRFPNYHDPAGNQDPYFKGVRLASSAPIKGTKFVVIVQVKR
jgi:serine/threonine protein kinase